MTLREPTPSHRRAGVKRCHVDRQWVADELRLWNQMMDPRSYVIWKRDSRGETECYKASRRPNGQLRKKRERRGRPVPATEEFKVAKSQQLYDRFIRH
jgi:hypothetical protein